MARDTAAIGADVVIGENTPPVETTVEALIRQYNRQPLNSSLSTGDLVYWDATAGNWVRVAGTKSAGQLPVAQADGTVAWGNGSYQAIAETVLGSSTASITFSSIPATFRSLLLVVEGGSVVAATSDPLLLQVNGDTGANYNYQTLAGNGTSTLASRTTGATASRIGLLRGSTADASTSSTTRLLIPNYTNTARHKMLLSECAAQATSMYTERDAGRWAATAAVSSLTVFGSTDNLAAGTIATLYGMKGA